MNLHSQSVRARELNFQKKVHLPLPFMCRHGICHKYYTEKIHFYNLLTQKMRKGIQCFVYLNRRQHFKTKTIIPCSFARSCCFCQKISEYCVNTRPWGPRRGLYRRAASLLGWKLSWSQLFKVKSFWNIFVERFLWTKNNLIGEEKNSLNILKIKSINRQH